MKSFLHVLPKAGTAGDPGAGAVLFRGQGAQLIAELSHIHRVIMRSDRQAVGDVLQPGDAEEYHPYLIATVREFSQRLGRHQLLRPRRQLGRGKFIGHASEYLADLVLCLVAGVREEKLYDRVLAHHRVASDQREKSQERAPPLFEKLRVRCNGRRNKKKAPRDLPVHYKF